MNIKELRIKHDLSQQDLADKTGIPKGRINQWERKKGKPKTDDTKILEQFFASLEKEVSHKPSMEDVETMNNETALSLAGKAIEALRTQLAVADSDKKVIWSEHKETVVRLENDKDRMENDKTKLYSIIERLTLAIGNAPAKQS